MQYDKTDTTLDIRYNDDNQFFVGVYFMSIAVFGALLIAIHIFKTVPATFAIFLSFFFVLGAAISALSPKIHTHVSKTDRTITISATNLINWHPKTTQFTVADIQTVEVDSFLYDARPGSKGSVVYLVLKSGKKIKIAAQQNYKSPLAKKHITEAEIAGMANDVADYLSIPLDNDSNKLHPLST